MAIANTAEAVVVGKFKDDVSSPAQKAFNKFKSVAKAAFATAVVGAVALAAAITKSIKLANQQELAVTKLEGALRATNQFSKEYSQTLQDQASELQKVTRFGDELILEQQALLISMGATERNIKQVTQAALDLSAGMGIDLRASTLLFGKALGGEFGTLSRYAILVDESASKTEKLAEALEQVNSKFGGQAEAQARTFRGQIDQMSAAFGDLLEQIGFVFTKNENLVGVLEIIKLKFEQWTGLIKKNRESLSSLVDAIFSAMKTAFRPLKPIIVFLGNAFLNMAAGILNAAGAWEASRGHFKEANILFAQAERLLEGFNINLNATTDGAIKLEKALPPLNDQMSQFNDLSKELSETQADNRQFGSNQRLDELKALFEQMKAFEEIDKQAFQFGFATDESSDIANNFRNGIKAQEAEIIKVTQAWEVYQRSIENAKTPLDNYSEQVDQLDFLLGKKIITMEQYSGAVDQVSEEWAKATEKGKEVNKTALDFSRAISTGFEDAALSAKSGSEIIIAALKDISRIALRATFTKPLEGFLTNFFSGFSLFGSAQGNVFSNGRIIPFGQGTVVSDQSFFPLGKDIGTLAEDGPEAIMPLGRTSSGDLGVKTVGRSQGATTVNKFFIDARGSNGDAAVEAAVIRGIKAAAPQIVEASVETVRDGRQRDPDFFGAPGTL